MAIPGGKLLLTVYYCEECGQPVCCQEETTRKEGICHLSFCNKKCQDRRLHEVLSCKNGITCVSCQLKKNAEPQPEVEFAH